MRIARTLLAAVTATIVSAGVAQAQATGLVKWAGVGTSYAWSSYSQTGTETQYGAWNVYTSPYRAQFNIDAPYAGTQLMPPGGPTGFGPAWDIFCVDFNHYSITDRDYAANFTNLGVAKAAADPNTIIGVATRSGHQLSDYLGAAYLAQQIYSPANASQIGAINGAIWQLMSGAPKYIWNTTTNGWDNSGINNWLSLARNEWNTVNASDWVVVSEQATAGTNVTDVGGQEYISHVTPEPATLLLLGTGLLATLVAAGAFRRSAV